jgi:hypothetical protein
MKRRAPRSDRETATLASIVRGSVMALHVTQGAPKMTSVLRAFALMTAAGIVVAPGSTPAFRNARRRRIRRAFLNVLDTMLAEEQPFIDAVDRDRSDSLH